ncbi:glucokinase [Edwardsiella anguillarum]|uniref:glucokinase n=1 Tax=Edwardsiella anguillarum TaxID=1821960 RepID=UPI00045CE0E6|nr:glucokinase [Edwardsiella anguillarum]GAJ67899.1 glucokinase [Edwardsiella piscicida]RFS99765.1 glucokinase [Edwardsiella anguillarum]BET80041.1 glucokinase [Edwardsiella anguillarum]BET83330.1 glucokinase [Edwardsiella anguillarum]BET86697.1 glucokinase [Edwardsiella anguillarum]
MTTFALVADVGGTNARLALCNLTTGELSRVQTYRVTAYPGPENLIRDYLRDIPSPVDDGCIAIACPVTGDHVTMTNHCWAFSVTALRRNLGFSRLDVINDFTAVSMAVPVLKPAHLIQLGGKEAAAGKPVAIYGAGTGLGIAHLIPVDNRWISLPGEGGHVDLAPGNKEEGDVLAILRQEMGHVSAERVLSGAGLVNLYRATALANGRLPESLSPEEVTEQALANRSHDARRALTLFCDIMGRFGGNLALTLGTTGGVYIAGGIVPRFLDFFKASTFRQRFEDKGRFTSYVQDIPVYLIVHDNPGLLGAGAYLRQRSGIPL